ncbi:MAG: nucleotidyltransferase domain-containing protein [Desulfatiglans sp.]|jgi:predicted nucleotidyltransferase|nr:nucleotidyltransferase domain-containing protein [Desulfatiglans sp.]
MAKTTLEIPREEWRKYNPSLIMSQNSYSDAEVEQQKLDAWQIARKASHLLKKNYSAKKVLLIGSLARESGYHLHSDIDIAVSGIAPEKFYSAVAEIIGLSPLFKIDLIDIDDCNPGLKKAIEVEGHLI